MRSAIIVEEDCRGCGRCLFSCPFQAIEMKQGVAIIKKDLCKGCMRCTPSCPTNAIQPA